MIGEVGAQTRGVEKLLRRIGFRYAERVDPFDGGPALHRPHRRGRAWCSAARRVELAAAGPGVELTERVLVARRTRSPRTLWRVPALAVFQGRPLACPWSRTPARCDSRQLGPGATWVHAARFRARDDSFSSPRLTARGRAATYWLPLRQRAAAKR